MYYVILCYILYRDSHSQVPPMDPSELNILKTVEEVTHYVKIQASHINLRNLSFLSKLKIIHGRQLDT